MDDKTRALIKQLKSNIEKLKKGQTQVIGEHKLVLDLKQKGNDLSNLQGEFLKTQTLLVQGFRGLVDTVKAIDVSYLKTEPTWLSACINKATNPILDPLREIATKVRAFKWPVDPENPIAVRLSNGKDFYDALTTVFSQGGGGSVPKISPVGGGGPSVPIVNPDGTSVGGGTQYADGDTAATPIGNQANWNEAGTQRATSLLKPLPVQPGTGVTFPVSASSMPLPTGAATEAKQDTGNTALSAIQTAVQLIDNIVAGNEAQVDVITMPADPFGANADAAATAGSTGSMQAKFRLMTSQLDSIKTAVETIDNVVAGSEAQVDIVAALPAGDNNIGNVDVVSSALPTGASTLAEQQTQTTALQLIDDIVYTSDAAISKVAGIGAQFDDTSPGTTTENSVRALRMSTRRELYSQIRDAAGNERGANVNASNELLVAVSSIPSHAVTNAGTFVVQENGAALTALQLIDNAISGAGFNITQFAGVNNATGSGTSTGALRVELPTNGTGIVGLAAGTNGIGKLTANSGVDIGDVDVTTVGTITPGTATTSLGKAEDAGHTTGDVGVMSLGVANTADAAISGTTLDYTPYTTDLTGAIRTIGNADHDATDAGKPLKIGYKAESSLASVTLVADGDRTDAYGDLDGVAFARPYSLGDLKSDATSNTDGASTASSVFTAVASTKNCIDGIHVFRTDSGTTPIYIDFRDGTGGSVLWRAVLPPNGGAIFPKADMPYFRTSANTALAYDVSAATTTVYINVSGFQSKV